MPPGTCGPDAAAAPDRHKGAPSRRKHCTAQPHPSPHLQAGGQRLNGADEVGQEEHRTLERANDERSAVGIVCCNLPARGQRHRRVGGGSGEGMHGRQPAANRAPSAARCAMHASARRPQSAGLRPTGPEQAARAPAHFLDACRDLRWLQKHFCNVRMRGSHLLRAAGRGSGGPAAAGRPAHPEGAGPHLGGMGQHASVECCRRWWAAALHARNACIGALLGSAAGPRRSQQL